MTNDLDITDSALAELRSAADIVEVVGEHTRLKKAGRSYKGLCPFHNERTPSFTVDRDKGLYHCFGCGAGGDVIHFVRQMDRLEFAEAIEALAGRFGVTIPRRARGPRDDRREKLLEAVSAAHRFYRAELAKPASRAAEYLSARGVTPEMVSRLELGQAADSWDALSRALSSSYPESLLIEAGLLQPGQDGKRAYDRFRDRLLFVLRDDRGRPVGFGGRVLSSEGEPKYLNSPESPIFQKKRTLYGLASARDAIRRRERVVLVEGYFDHLALLSAGVEETVASMGTALTPEQAEKLRRLAPKVVVCYDGDPAGRSATRGALALLLGQGFSARVAKLPAGKDPHDVLREEGPEPLAARIEDAPDALDWLLDPAGAGSDPMEQNLSAADKSDRIAGILEILQAVPDTILRHEECRRLARHVAVPLDILWERIRPKTGRIGVTAPPPRPGTPGNDPVLREGEMPASERRLLHILLNEPEYNPLVFSTLRDEFLTHPLIGRVVGALRKAPSEGEGVDFQRQIAHLTEEDRILVSGIALEDHPAPTEKGVEGLLKDLEKKYLERESADIQREIDRAVASSSTDLAELIRRKQENGRRRGELSRSPRWKGM
ncbi:MAG: DNA primase [Acidobacteria bacterium]|nr:DNA primase [Acidobacteriota bacterium]MCA1611880.1 DNA primase [Acidobacteriota bacterium]